MKPFLSALLILLSIASLWTQEPAALESAFEAANSAYSEARYEEAQAGYESIVEGHLHFESEFNLGNAFFKQGKLGHSILHYERAKRINPSNSDLESNLILANARVIDRIEALPTAGIEDLWERILSPGRYPTVVPIDDWFLDAGIRRFWIAHVARCHRQSTHSGHHWDDRIVHRSRLHEHDLWSVETDQRQQRSHCHGGSSQCTERTQCSS